MVEDIRFSCDLGRDISFSRVGGNSNKTTDQVARDTGVYACPDQWMESPPDQVVKSFVMICTLIFIFISLECWARMLGYERPVLTYPNPKAKKGRNN